jgi:hypothetical protein
VEVYIHGLLLFLRLTSTVSGNLSFPVSFKGLIFAKHYWTKAENVYFLSNAQTDTHTNISYINFFLLSVINSSGFRNKLSYVGLFSIFHVHATCPAYQRVGWFKP